LHGEAVAIGCVLAFELSARLGFCSQEEPSRLRAHFAALGLVAEICDIAGPLPDADAMMGLMDQDKKVVDGTPRYVLAHRIGQAFVSDAVDPQAVKDLLSAAMSQPARRYFIFP
ncbi:MAG: 3-dehydroquinate synthase, partial [Paracoccaceae bacterium]